MTRTDLHWPVGSLFSTLSGLLLPTQVMPTHAPAERAPRASSLTGALARAVDAVLTWQERGRQRRQLMRLDDHLLRDIGLTRADVAAEWEKPFWRP